MPLHLRSTLFEDIDEPSEKDVQVWLDAITYLNKQCVLIENSSSGGLIEAWCKHGEFGVHYYDVNDRVYQFSSAISAPDVQSLFIKFLHGSPPDTSNGHWIDITEEFAQEKKRKAKKHRVESWTIYAFLLGCLIFVIVVIILANRS